MPTRRRDRSLAATGACTVGQRTNRLRLQREKYRQGIEGNCNVAMAPPTAREVVDVTSLTRSGTHATIFGTATINGTTTAFRIDVDDHGEPGAGRDTFRIVTSSGYSPGGILKGGNIQVK